KEIVTTASGKTVKDLLTAQEKIAGIGNIYSDEMMRRAGVRPDRRVGTLTGAEVERLHQAIPEVLEDAIAGIEAGKEGHMLAWRRKGQICPDCGGEVIATKRGASHYYWCPRCQK
ncbi:MAG TPA: zinc finger domain-containing protein, partial [Anaerolineae bacterium]|nr:zinc finger domain-containing protein [Anaerolineae bacterium]